MGTGSEAQNRMVKDWLASIDRGQLRLPSFQRGVAWEPTRVVSMLNTIINDLPLGVALVLNVGDTEQFVSRPLESAPQTKEAVTEHLLDGQQRLTALYRALRDNDDNLTYFVHFPDLDQDPNNDDIGVSVRATRRSIRKGGVRFPIWADSPKECLLRGLVPVRLLDPTNSGAADWVDAATTHLAPGDDVTDIAAYKEMTERVTALREKVKLLISEMRETVKHFNLPYLRLPATTSKDVALSVFVNMNTNAKPLKPHDIVVAELEGATGHRLKEMEARLDKQQPRLKHYLSLDNAVLQTSALLQGKPPNQQGFFDMDYTVFADNWNQMARGLHRAIQTVQAMRIVDGERLPSAVPIPVMAALLASQPEDGDHRATVDRLMRKYAWRSFFTNRYEATGATRAVADYRALATVLAGAGKEDTVPVFNEDLFPLPTLRDLKAAGWPKAKRSLSRAILASSNYFGARDLADDTELSLENITTREYHHVFPGKLLDEAGITSSLALNCVLITWKTNRTIGRSDPLTYLKDRAQKAPSPDDVSERLASHLVPYDAIKNAGPYQTPAGEELRQEVSPDFDNFLDQRATLVMHFMEVACDGGQPHLKYVFDNHANE